MSTSNAKKVKKHFDWAFDATTQFASSDEDSEREPVQNASDFPSCPSEYAHILTPKASQHRDMHMLSNIRKSPFYPSLNERQHVQDPPTSLLPPASTSNDLANKRIPHDSSSSFMQVKSTYPKCDEYQFSPEDPDEEWTTLPPKKKKRSLKTELPRALTYTKPFRIPGLRLPPTMKAETITAPAARKVKMYLPPPLNAVDVRYPTTKKNSEYNRTGLSMDSDETEDRKRAFPTNFEANPYPSPSTSRSNPLLISSAKRSHNYTPPRCRPGVRVDPYRPPSPPTSDLPIPNDADISVQVDHEGIRLRYPGTKRLSRKYRRASADVWNLLGLDSCGYVRKDIEGGGQDEQMEIQIVVWPPP